MTVCEEFPLAIILKEKRFHWQKTAVRATTFVPAQGACFEKGVLWHSGKLYYRVWIHSETRMWHVITYSQIHRTGKHSQHGSIIWSVWLNGWVFVYELNGCGFESCCCHLNFRYGAGFEQGGPWHSGKL